MPAQGIKHFRPPGPMPLDIVKPIEIEAVFDQPHAGSAVTWLKVIATVPAKLRRLSL